MPDVELRHLRAMAVIAEEGTFGQAAARLGYTQSSVSQQIAALEKAVGGPVFDRPGGPRPVRVTPLGEVVLAHGRDLLTRAEALTDAVDRFQAGNGRIDIGTFQGVSNLILPSVIRRLLEEHPGCDIRLSDVKPEDPRIGELDLLFHDGPIEGDVEHVKLFDEPYLLVTGAGTFPDGPVRVKLLDDAPMVAWPPTYYQRWLERTLARSGAQPRFVFRTTGHETILSMVRVGIGWAVLPWLALHGHDAWSDDQLSIHQLKPSPERELSLYWPAGRTESPLAIRTREIAIDVARSLAEQM
ncbi:DNA-binding transcriptional LysR family regulator [Kibdelosporangium banguiense]|uniref:DNA-binding transcriptional LysR family regulator n=1 Tax=Kibdelosporangium banguiense TaxID=1365924 RepID=A0ABS4TW12_9PSEU|nr:LysR family transcriptional regulator [Kibdelosporangium banguiense]MBP2328106.1 DNA-binding transcriptional LysR family regulator [Kibdelosporangium banguiense]